MSGSRLFSVASVSARVIVGAVAATGTVALVVLAIAAPWPQFTSPPLALDVRPAASDVTLSCPGGIVISGRASMDALAIDIAATPETTAGSPSTETPTTIALAVPDVQGETGAVAYREVPAGADRAKLAAAQTTSVAAHDVRGLAATGCAAPLSESWLVGGATTTGWSGFVQLGNPGDVPASVELTVFTADGASGMGSVVIVPPRSQRVLPLAGLAVAADNPVVRVTAQGAPVTATLQSNRIRTITPSGVDIQTAVALPDMRQVIPGVVVPAREVTADPDAATTVVRVLSPASDGTASVTATATGQDAAALGPITVPLKAGVPVDVELPGLEAGNYTVRVDGSLPIVSAVWQATQASAGGDYAWHAAAPVIAAPSMFAVAGGASATLHVVNDSAENAAVTVTAATGTQMQVAVPAGGAVAMPIARAGIYSIDADGLALRAAVSLVAPAGIAAYPVWSSEALGKAVTVYP